MMKRNQSLDALRGFAILTMVLSGSIAFGGVLPAWMYHAQVPPPQHVFNPALPGITWVDLVFPFFLFSMGAAIPLALSKGEEEGAGLGQVFWIAARRFLLLTFFALFTYHMRALVIAEEPTVATYLLSVLGFVLLCFQFYAYKGDTHKRIFVVLKALAFVTALVLLWLLPFNKGVGFRLDKVDIIILVLGNMAFFGTLIWWLTRNRPALRVGLLAFVLAVFLGQKEPGSWNSWLYRFSPLPWMYQFYYLKYLFIIVPGTFAGEWLLRAKDLHHKNANPAQAHRGWVNAMVALLCIGLVVCNTALLYSRMVVLNLILTAALCLFVHLLLTQSKAEALLQKFVGAGTFLLLLGLFFEAYEGGIKKDPSTYSYYFVTSGLAFFMLTAFSLLQQGRWSRGVVGYLGLNGRNPMVAYVAGNLLLIPLLHLTGAIRLFDGMTTNAWLGFVRGLLFTGLVSLLTVFFTRRQWYWKT